MGSTWVSYSGLTPVPFAWYQYCCIIRKSSHVAKMFKMAYGVWSFFSVLALLWLHRRGKACQQALLSRNIESIEEITPSSVYHKTVGTADIFHYYLLHLASVACLQRSVLGFQLGWRWIESSPQMANKTDILLLLHTLPRSAIITHFRTSIKPGSTLPLSRVHPFFVVPCERIDLVAPLL